MCTECQKVGIHIYLSNCNGRATVEVFSAIPVLNMTALLTLLRRSCIQETLISAFYLLRERPEDPHVERSNELHEPSAYFCHRSWCCDVYSAAEGKPGVGTLTDCKGALIFRCTLMIRLSSAAGETSREHHHRLGVKQQWVMLSSFWMRVGWRKCQRRNYIVF